MSDFTSPPPNMEPVAIYQDGGGLVGEYARAAWDYRMKGREVKIIGYCGSACILALAVPKVCIGPYAMVRAHMARDRRTGKPDYQSTNAMINILPDNIADVLRKNIDMDYNEKTTFHTEDLVALGFKRCKTHPSWKPTSVSADYRPFLPEGWKD